MLSNNDGVNDSLIIDALFYPDRLLPGEEEASGHAPQIRTITHSGTRVCRAWTHIFIRVKTLSNWRELSGSSVLLHRHLPSVWNLSQNSSFSVFCPSCVVQEQESVIPLWALPVYLFAFQLLTFTWKIPLNRCVEERFETSMNESFRITILLKKDFITNNDML